MTDMAKTLDRLDEVAGKITSLRVSAAGDLIDKEKLIKALTTEINENQHPCDWMAPKIWELEEQCRVLKDAISSLEVSDKAFTKAYVALVDHFIE